MLILVSFSCSFYLLYGYAILHYHHDGLHHMYSQAGQERKPTFLDHIIANCVKPRADHHFFTLRHTASHSSHSSALLHDRSARSRYAPLHQAIVHSPRSTFGTLRLR